MRVFFWVNVLLNMTLHYLVNRPYIPNMSCFVKGVLKNMYLSLISKISADLLRLNTCEILLVKIYHKQMVFGCFLNEYSLLIV